MTDKQKNELFDDAMTEFERSLSLLKKKFSALGTKVSEMSSLTRHFHDATDKMESNFNNDIEKRRLYFQEHELVKGKSDDPTVDLSKIDEIFDAIEKEEQKSSIMILLTIPNISLMGVIASSCYLWINLQ